jgi:hypothetical protein
MAAIIFSATKPSATVRTHSSCRPAVQLAGMSDLSFLNYEPPPERRGRWLVFLAVVLAVFVAS